MTDQEENPNPREMLNASIVTRRGITKMNVENGEKIKLKQNVRIRKRKIHRQRPQQLMMKLNLFVMIPVLT